jgi:shikimate 5-dehydrogenase
VTARRFPEASAFERLGADLFAWDDDRALAGSEIVVQATSAGMRGGDPGEAVAARVPWAELASGAVALDVVYNPRVTPFLAAARAAGLACEGGLPMLVGQAARAIEIWLGRRPAASVLSNAAERALEVA